ncbi:MFS transporter [Pseudomonas citronellolis]|uniref:MFS transporter n=1 Tax=Pseudomonas citronellolis TaxID=53408 RepID=UPI0020A22BF9|nr:MFS transporter [Pseudomonas citronellolis]MCP1605652.1 MFS family permease [Pseudomonas citronellolis]MCP1656194.1 MFS family permease [Pseudomonas citronellolis]MCP1722354.1 MFS family permease [Pseudomonas citronellolis]
MSSPEQRPHAVTLQIVSIVSFTFLLFLCIGFLLPVLPGFVHHELGFDATTAGLVIGAQYLATLASRPLAGRLTDTLGAKRAVIYGLLSLAGGGALVLLATSLQALVWTSLALLLGSRLLIGFAQGLMGIGTASWGIARVGAQNTARVISWNGIVCYGGIALGAPLGVGMAAQLGLWSLGAGILALAGLGLLLARGKAPAPIIAGTRMAFFAVLGRVLPYGMCVALGSIGFGSLATFITLYYGSRGWADPAWCLSLFGISFVGARLLLSWTINRFGGFNVAVLCLLVESAGLLLLWQAPSPAFALLGTALTGAGLSLVYPALGVEAVLRIPAASRSSALGAYALFFDLALGLAGPLMGAVAAHSDYASIFLVAALLAACGFLICLWLLRFTRQRHEELDFD